MAGIAQAVEADAAFGTDLYRQLAAAGNVVLSPASIDAALRMALAGARGETAAELAAALHVSGPEAAADGLKQLAGIRSGDDLTFRAPNIMWLESAASVRDDYLARLSDAVSGVIDPLTRLVLTNAVYMKALWTHQFPASETKQKPFYPERTGATPADLMHLRTRLAYHRGDGYQAVLLPYRGGSLAMAAVLPDGPLSEFAGRLGDLGGIGALLAGLLSGDAEHDVDLSFPRFKITAGFMLADTLQALGVRAAFAEDADFSGISDTRLRISAVVHKAYIDVGEEGTEAAAATGTVFTSMAVIKRPEPDVRLVFDHPFLFMIVDTETGLPLFLGQFTRPPS